MERIEVQPGMDVLDVACGTGNATIPVARLGARATGFDLVPELLAIARERAADAMVEVDWVEGDAEHLPFAPDSLRPRAVDVRLHVRPRPRAHGDGAAARLPARRRDRDVQLDARTAPSATCSPPSPASSAPPPAGRPSRRPPGAPRSTCASCSARMCASSSVERHRVSFARGVAGGLRRLHARELRPAAERPRRPRPSAPTSCARPCSRCSRAGTRPTTARCATTPTTCSRSRAPRALRAGRTARIASAATARSALTGRRG